jgi:branched-chain amino acid transport system ATP-binding protein
MMLRAENLSKSFMGIHALKQVSMEIVKGEILGVIGPNGAGKTTLFNVLTGLFPPDSGSINFTGKDITRLKPHRRVKLGMTRTFQNLELFRDMSVLDNVMVGGHLQLRAGFWASMAMAPWKVKEEKRLQEEAFKLLEILGIDERAGEQAINLSYGDQRRVEIARALISRPHIMFLDEPAAGMNPRETGELSSLIIKLKNELDLTIVIIEHDMNLIMDICERIIVMAEGSLLATGVPQEIRKHPKVLEAYLGGEVL